MLRNETAPFGLELNELTGEGFTNMHLGAIQVGLESRRSHPQGDHDPEEEDRKRLGMCSLIRLALQLL